MDIALLREKTAAEHGHPVSQTCEKCGDMPMMMMEEPPPPLGGATSFASLKAYREAQQEEGLYYTATLDFQDLQANILRNEDMDVQAKASALVALTTEFQKVVNNVDAYYPGMKETEEDDEDKAGKRMSGQQVGKFYGALDTLKKLFKWAKYEEDDEENKSKSVDFAKSSGFKIFNTKEGPRWLTYSSNAFKDLEGELFTTAALEEAVEWSDKTNERGPLRIFHVPGADVGDADYQAVVGRFLVESGTFRNDDLGQKAIEYFQEHDDEDFQVSIGFTFKSGDEKDGVYDWLRIRERSVTPHGDAANPFTSFAFGGLGGKEMEERKRKMLDDIFGADLASRIVGQAETKSKELEDGGISFKSLELSTEVTEELTAFARDLPEESRTKFTSILQKAKMPPQKDPKMMADQADEGDSQDKKPPAKKELDSEAVVTAIEALTTRLDEFKDLQESIATLEKQVKELVEADEKANETPRGSKTYRTTEANDNVLDPDKIKELVGDKGEDAPVNPARIYVESLIGSIGSN